MKTYRNIVIAVLAGLLSTAAAWAQSTCWRIVDGPAAGLIVHAENGIVFDPIYEHGGQISQGVHERCECLHYHGFLFGVEDPTPEGCGWGCVERVPCSESEAYDDFLNALGEIAEFAPVLADKIEGAVINTMLELIHSGCSSLFVAAASSIGEEIQGALQNDQIIEEEVDELLQEFAQWVNLALDEMPLPEPTNNPCGPCKVNLVLRKASGPQTKFFDAKRRVNADLGQVVVLDREVCPEDAAIMWEYQFKGEGQGNMPSGTGVSFTPNRFCVIAERPTTVTVTVIARCPDGKEVKDKVTIVYK